MDKFLKFPEGFFWGGSSAPEQSEGKGVTKKGKTVWDKLYAEQKDKFWDGIGPNPAIDFTRKYKEDIAMWKEMGINAIRFGLAWSRLFPDGPEKVDPEAVALYHDIIDEMKKAKINPIINLYHWGLPIWAADMGGFESKDVVNAFAKFARLAFSEYGKKVKYFSTMNEPQVVVFSGYNSWHQWPGRLSDDQGAYNAWFNTILAHAKAVKIFREEFGHLDCQIGAITTILEPIPKDGINYDEKDLQACKNFDLLFNRIWTYSMAIGKIPEEIFDLLDKNGIKHGYDEKDLEIIRQTKLDWLGLNYYTPKRMQKYDVKNLHPDYIKAYENEKKYPLFHTIGSDYKWKDARINVFRGWEIRPQSLYEIAMTLKKDLNNIPFMITENGMGVENEDRFRNESGQIQDDYRIAFLHEHLAQLNKAINDGANCFGYLMWAATDNWSWRNAFKNRYSYIEVNIKDMSRKFKKSAFWFRDVIKNNGFIDDGKKIEDFMDLKNIEYKKSL